MATTTGDAGARAEPPVVAPREETPVVSRRRRFSVRRIITLLVILGVLAAAGVFGYNYWQNSLLYVSTDDALVDSNLVPIASPGGGTLAVWRVNAGDTVQAGQVIGTVRPAPGGSSTYTNIAAPINGTVIRRDAKEGQVIGAASALAYVADLNHVTITAYIDETEIRRVKVGQQVAVTVDASGKTDYQGTVTEILPAAATSFSVIPSTDRGTGNFTKVTQRIEVHIDIGDTSNSGLYPGENASVRIRAS